MKYRQTTLSRICLAFSKALFFSCWMCCLNICQAQGIANLVSAYPTAPSIQIDPATTTDADLRRIREAGFEFVRLGARPQRKDVNPNLVDYSAVLRRIRQAGLRAIVTVFGGRAVWEVGNTAHEQKNAAQFSEFARDFMKSNAGDVAVWEIWNEPDNSTFLDKDDYGVFDSAVSMLCTEIKRMRPSPPIIIGLGFAKIPFVSNDVPLDLEHTTIAAARTGCLTDISVHPYRSKPETVIASYEDLRKNLDKLGLHATGIVASEWGYASYVPVREEHAQASLLVREYLVNVAVGVRLLNVYAWRDRGDSVFSREDNFGIVSFSGAPKEAYVSLSSLLKLLKNSHKVSFTQISEVNELTLDDGGNSIHVVWTEGSERLKKIFTKGRKNCTRIDFFSTKNRRDCGVVAEGFIPVTVSADPIAYVFHK